MKIEDLDNYVLKITEKYMRYYYSAEAQILKNETTEYEISKGLQIFTSVSAITIQDYFSYGNEIYGIYVKYIDEDCYDKTVEINFDSPVTIKLITGNDDISRVSICTLEIVEKK